MKTSKVLLSIFITSTAAVSTGTMAQQGNLALEEVIVSAQRRDESLQTVPVSVAVETGAELEKKGIGDLKSLSAKVPGLFIEDGGATSNLAIRGLSSPGIESVEPSVGLYIDNISLARPRGITQNPFYDLARIEVLRGPQGTLWGRNTIAGAINIVTERPTEEFEAYVSAEAGNYSARKFEAAISGPLTDTLSGRLSVYNAERDGYLDNQLGGPDGGGYDSEAYRGQLRWRPVEPLEIHVKYEHVDHLQRGHSQQMVGAGPGQLGAEIESRMRARGEDFKVDKKQYVEGTGLWAKFVNDNDAGQGNDSDLASLNIDYQFESGYQLTSQTGYIDYTTDRLMEFSGGPLNVIGLNNVGDATEYRSQEFRVISPVENRVHFVTGVFADRLEVSQAGLKDGNFNNGNTSEGYALVKSVDASTTPATETLLLARNGDEEEVESWAVFGEVTIDFSEKWVGTLGARHGEEKKDFTDRVGLEILTPEGTPGNRQTGIILADGESGTELRFDGQQWVENLKRDDDFTTWSAKLQHFFTNDVMFYASTATGFKSGGFNNGSNTLVRSDKVFDSEDSLAFELGMKAAFLDNRVHFNVALFRVNFDDLQVSTTDAQGVIVTTNAAEATNQGVELDFKWRVAQDWTLGGAYAYLDTEYEQFDGAPCGPFEADSGACDPATGKDMGGEALQRAPENSGSLYAEYFSRLLDTDWDLMGFLQYAYRDAVFTSIDNEFKSDVLKLVSARIGVVNDSAGWTVALHGENLLDERALIANESNALIGGAQFGVITTPRTYALQIKKTF